MGRGPSQEAGVKADVHVMRPRAKSKYKEWKGRKSGCGRKTTRIRYAMVVGRLDGEISSQRVCYWGIPVRR